MSISTLGTDISAMLAHCGVSVTIGGVTDYGSLKTRNAVQQSQGMEVLTRVTTLVVKTGTFTLTNGATVTANSVTYRLDSWELMEGDGSQTMLYLSRGT